MTDRAKILLVDDREENLVALEAILSSLDLDLVRARSGEEALKSLLGTDFALILMDVQMPGMDGFETASHIKRRERTRDVPIIFLTVADGEPNSIFRGYAVGAVDYLTKPFDPWVLRAKVSVFVDLYEKNRRVAEQATLLRDRLAEEIADESSDAILARLSARLTAVEEELVTVRDQVQRYADATLDEPLGRLTRHIASLRAGFDAINSPN